MANGQVQSQISDDYLKQFDRSVGVAGIRKLSRWPMLQKLGYNGQLGHITNGFHGLDDFRVQMDMYSGTNFAILEPAWGVIQTLVPANPQAALNLFHDPALGSVGKMFQTVQNFGQVFALSPEVLSDPGLTAQRVASVSAGNAGF